MTKKTPTPPPLNLGRPSIDGARSNPSPLSPGSLSPSSKSGMTSPTSPAFKGPTIRPLTAQSVPPSEKSIAPPKSSDVSTHTDDSNPPPTPDITAIPPFPPSPKDASSKHGRETSKSFFSSFKSSKSSHRTQPSDVSSGQLSDQKPVSRGSSKDRSLYKSGRARNESSTDLPRAIGSREGRDDAARPDTASHSNKPEDTLQSYKLVNKKSKGRFNLLTRTRSIRHDDQSLPTRPSTARRPSNGIKVIEEISAPQPQEPLKTAPLQNERAFREAMESSVRNRSADRPQTKDGNTHNKKERSYASSVMPTSLTSSSLVTNLKHTSANATKTLGRAGKEWFGKITRGGSSVERDTVTDDNYVCKVINLPLVEQCRLTRISKRLQDSKDKTEYWMPALPWRCIDYLNYKGCEEEGLYRVPGSGRDVKHWQRRFDTELDINLFDEPELYDINTIGSMFKAWLRELPDEIFPRETQAKIEEQCAGATTVPQMLKDELSKLPPFNYYLLFAITCHLSLLHSYVDKNKMDYRNLCICFQPCMKIDAFCFQFLVCDWKNCWQGCWTEKEYLEKELEYERQMKEEAEKLRLQQLEEQQLVYTKTLGMTSPVQERAPYSLGSKNHNGNNTNRTTRGRSKSSVRDENMPPTSRSTSPPKRSRKKSPPGNIDSSHSRSTSQLPELGPPLSPIQI
ncbi:hypothetical protein VTO42DRAFT_4611 [Malbranchea cinnamomea]